MLVKFHGRGDWFLNADPNDKYGPRLAHNFCYRDPETGDIESTNEFFRIYDGIDQKLCSEFIGVFKLSKKDTAIYLDSNSFDHVEKLLPCVHEYSGLFIAMEENGYLCLSENDLDNCFFLIQKEVDMSCFEHKKISTAPYAINNTLKFIVDSERFDINITNVSNIINSQTSEATSSEISTHTPAYLDKANPLFKENNELHIAIDAWNTVVEQESGDKITIRKKIINWLSNNKNLTDEQIKRIASVANPDRARKPECKLAFNQNIALKISEFEKYLDHRHMNHSSWLRAAIEAWIYTLSDTPESPKTGSLKSLPIKWLNDNYPTISKSNIERLAVLINPDSNGGPPKSI
ncbi:hypothetical protein [Methylomonas koyamae]|uniref:Uncharacterized protein n=1 Tax=Methylomonas koyamae TaxID=702114 RepID=A0A291IGJ4_9GAMM|nr:hypothetical protein [Methylomonas koyamae]ATG89473.1 hypothetical protein MKLM6_1216 [Methylomonas koyamae]OAI22787.1 hypothetical protein A1356_18810 [Methylomonas koyamae]